MASKLRQFQTRIASLILADQTHFAVPPSAQDLVTGAAPAETKVNVIIDVPGDIETVVDRAIGKAGIAVIVWTPRRVPSGESRARARKYVADVWVRERVTTHRSKPGALTAEEVAELIDELVDRQASGLMPQAQGELGIIKLAPDGIQPRGGEDADLNEFVITFETEARLR